MLIILSMPLGSCCRLVQLQDATQLSVIPPLEPGEPYRTSSTTTDPPSRNGDNVDANNPVNALGIMLPTRPASFTTFPFSQSRRDEQGYTIRDGPWIYTSKKNSIILKGKLGEEKGKKLEDKISYDNMIQILRGERVSVTQMSVNASPSSLCALVVEIIHSMDRDAIKWHKEEQQAIDEEEKQFCEDLTAQGLTEDDFGEPFGAYLKKEIQMEKLNAWKSRRGSKYRASHGSLHNHSLMLK
ncbi:hypothetical protein ONS96_006810 [Cadophora gregata f. sp. sojae]|nr:hypothetical protein ONS96_006810 [Cadophora gregata f. sp. sojae]